MNAASTARGLLRRLSTTGPPPAGAVHVLAYHLVGAGTGSPVDLLADDFREQMEGLARRGGAVSLDAAERHLRVHSGEAPSPAATPAVVLTFDDAYRNILTHAWPVLRDLDLPATVYVPTAFVDAGRPVPMAAAADLPAMTWDELARVREEGVTLGSHSHSHRELPALGDAEITIDLERARELLRRHTGSEAEHFCYPRALWDRRTEKVVGGHHRTAAVAGGRVNRAGGAPARGCLRLTRVPVRSDLGPSLDPVLDSATWWPEWVASRVRGPRAAWRRRTDGNARHGGEG